jgi:hypothetical protein
MLILLFNSIKSFFSFQQNEAYITQNEGTFQNFAAINEVFIGVFIASLVLFLQFSSKLFTKNFHSTQHSKFKETSSEHQKYH